MLQDRDPQVVANCVTALEEVRACAVGGAEGQQSRAAAAFLIPIHPTFIFLQDLGGRGRHHLDA
jgi:hypothetical protein